MRLLSIWRSDRHVDLALLVLRLAIGVVFVAHGGQKLFTFGIDGVAQGFGQMGIPAPGFFAPLVSVVEFAGGIMLVAGLLARLAALALAVNMLVAMLVVHLPSGFFLPQGIEFTLVLFAGCVALLLAGPGRISADAIVGRRWVPPA